VPVDDWVARAIGPIANPFVTLYLCEYERFNGILGARNGTDHNDVLNELFERTVRGRGGP
jgi:hypothetical protein